jgi:hypothetical protein
VEIDVYKCKAIPCDDRLLRTKCVKVSMQSNQMIILDDIVVLHFLTIASLLNLSSTEAGFVTLTE